MLGKFHILNAFPRLITCTTLAGPGGPGVPLDSGPGVTRPRAPWLGVQEPGTVEVWEWGLV